MQSVATANDFRVFERLKKDSEEIELALDQFMKERDTALHGQLLAKNDYDADMKRLDETSLLVDYEKMVRNTVDHNLLRHLNVAVEGTGSNIPDEYGDAAFEDDYEGEYEQPVLGQGVSKPKVVLEKKQVPSFEEKIALREKMFSFLDEARLAEMELEMQLGEMREAIAANGSDTNKLNINPSASNSIASGAPIEDTINYNFQVSPDELRVDALQDSLFELQKKHSDQLKDLFDDYQPQPFGKAWGNDPDYIELSEKLKNMLQNGQKLKASYLLSNKKSTSSGTKGKKKKKSKK